MIVNNPLVKRACLFMCSPIAERILLYLYQRETWEKALTKIQTIGSHSQSHTCCASYNDGNSSQDVSTGITDWGIAMNRHGVLHSPQWRSEPRTFNSGSTVSIRNNVSGKIRQENLIVASFPRLWRGCEVQKRDTISTDEWYREDQQS
jgi:hypothetical protein